MDQVELGRDGSPEGVDVSYICLEEEDTNIVLLQYICKHMQTHGFTGQRSLRAPVCLKRRFYLAIMDEVPSFVHEEVVC